MSNDIRRFFLIAASTMSLVLGTMGGCMDDGRDPPSGDELARASLEMLPGCYAVRYQFVEDGARDFFFENGIEYVELIPRGDGFVARNYLITGEDSAFLHWIQEWTPLGEGRWRMRVTDGAGNERYVSEGVWRAQQWEGEPALAVKPTRDGNRADYDMLERRNVIQFTPGYWVQSEVNRKLRADGSFVSSELGWIVYEQRQSDELCAPAIALSGVNV